MAQSFPETPLDKSLEAAFERVGKKLDEKFDKLNEIMESQFRNERAFQERFEKLITRTERWALVIIALMSTAIISALFIFG